MRFNETLVDNACSLLVSQSIALFKQQPNPDNHNIAMFRHVKGNEQWVIHVVKEAIQVAVAA